MSFATRLIQSGLVTDVSVGSLSVPLLHSSTFAQTSVDRFRRDQEQRSGESASGSARLRNVGQWLIGVALEGGTQGFAFASGMAAISSTLLLFSPGDHLIVSEDVYGGAFRVMTKLFSRWASKSTILKGLMHAPKSRIK